MHLHRALVVTDDVDTRVRRHHGTHAEIDRRLERVEVDRLKLLLSDLGDALVDLVVAGLGLAADDTTIDLLTKPLKSGTAEMAKAPTM